MHISYERLSVDENNLFHCQEFKQPRFTSPFHLHDEFELIFIAKGYGKLYVGNNVTNFDDGGLYFFAPGLPHCFYNEPGYEKGSDLAHAYVVQFKKDFLGPGFPEKNETTLLKRFLTKSEKGIQILNPSKTLIYKFIHLEQKKGLEKVSDFLLILNELSSKKNISLLSSGEVLMVGNLNDSKIINNVYRYVAENFQNDISFSKAASVANMQKSAFCRYFMRKTKKKFTDFVNETRIMHARKLLSETDKSVIEVAFECGYANTSYFNRQFRKYCHSTPIEFRNQILGSQKRIENG